MRCLRICGAYSFRLTRRHSTYMLIGSFIIILMIIFQLYSYRHRNLNQMRLVIGDFDYRPGTFLEGIQPNPNISYCRFNHGLPNQLKWDSIRVFYPPEVGSKSHYRVIYNAIQGYAYENVTKYNAVTYATQATPEYVYHIVEIARLWEGPISLAVYVPNYDLDITMQLLSHLCHCFSGMSKVSLHLFYPASNPPVLKREPIKPPTIPPTKSNITADELLRMKLERYRSLNKAMRAEYIESARKNKIQKMMMKMPTKRTLAPRISYDDCSGPDTFDLNTFRRENNMIYPINVGRNAARNATKTNYFIVSDIEMLPSEGLAPKFLAMVRKLMGDKKRDEGCLFAKMVFVVPLFEVEKGEAIPRDKETLVRMVADNKARYFHQRTCSHCQRFPGMQTWLSRPPISNIQPMVIARREYPYHRWEPLYFGTHKEPWYSEMLSWEGQQDKMTQMLEICLQQYRFVVLDGCFMIHYSNVFKVQRNNWLRRHRSMISNLYRYSAVIEYFKQKYKKYADTKKSKCKRCFVMYGF